MSSDGKVYAVPVVIHGTIYVKGVEALSGAIATALDIEGMTARVGHYDDCPLIIEGVQIKQVAEVAS